MAMLLKMCYGLWNAEQNKVTQSRKEVAKDERNKKNPFLWRTDKFNTSFGPAAGI